MSAIGRLAIARRKGLMREAVGAGSANRADQKTGPIVNVCDREIPVWRIAVVGEKVHARWVAILRHELYEGSVTMRR